VSLRERRRVSWWTSVGFTGLGLFGAAVVQLVPISSLGGRRLFLEADGIARTGRLDFEAWADDSRSRLLQDDAEWMYPDDPILEEKGDPIYSEADHKWLIIVHIFLMGYMILGLNTVCDIYFTGALDVMVDRWNVKPDVAGATFMAAGGSAPELFTSLIGAVVSQSDVGFGTIVGSAVFNVLFVIGMCGWSATTPIDLTWWPLFRDCTYYIFGLSLLAGFARSGNEIEWWEAMLLFFGYIFYCILMYFNEYFEVLVKGTPVQATKDEGEDGPGSHVIQITDCEDEQAGARAGSKDPTLKQARSIEAVPGPPEHHIGRTENSQDVMTSQLSNTQISSTPRDHKHHIRKPYFDREHSHSPHHPNHPEHPADGKPDGDGTTSKTSNAMKTPGDVEDGEDKVAAESAEVAKNDAMEEDEMSDDPDDIEEMMTAPEERMEYIMWIFKLPIYAPLYYLTPKPTERCFIATFFCSLLWIAGFSFFLVWWIEILCSMVKIDSIVAGLTVLAASTSIPDLVSSMAVARAGEGDMAVSSSIGSNIFDIMVGLPIPWMIKILIVEGDPKETVKIQSKYIVLYVLLLLFMVLCVILSIHLLKWKLTRALGVCMAALYVLFLTIALTVEFTKPSALEI